MADGAIALSAGPNSISRLNVSPMSGRLAPLLANPAVRRALPLLAALAVAGVLALLWLMIASPPQRALFTGLSDEDKAALVETLGTAGIAYTVDTSNGAVTVSESDYYSARMAAAADGLPRGASSGLDLMDGMPLGASRAVEGERIRSAREQDLARTIEAMDAVGSARVHLALPEASAFVRVRNEPAASIMVELAGGRALSEQQVQAIVHLVASSVPGLSPDNIAVADQRGSLLSNAGGAGAADERQREARQGIEQDYREAVSAILTPLLGAGNFAAEVSADVDFSQVQSTREGFPESSSVLRSEQRSLSSDGAAGATGGIPGALANQPPDAAVVSAAPGGTVTADGGQTGPGTIRQSENLARDFAVGREVSVTQQQSPRVRRVSVAVLLRNVPGTPARSAADLRQIEALVQGAVGYDAARGDAVEIAARGFAPVVESAASWWESDWFAAYLRTGAASLLALLFLLIIARPLLKRMLAKSEAPAGGAPLALIEGQAGVNEGTPITVEMIEGSPAYEARAALIRGFVKQDPARAALVVRDLIRNEGQ